MCRQSSKANPDVDFISADLLYYKYYPIYIRILKYILFRFRKKYSDMSGLFVIRYLLPGYQIRKKAIPGYKFVIGALLDDLS